MRPTYVAIPGRHVSTGATVERALAVILDRAETAFTAAADTREPGPWAATVGYGNGLIAAAAIVAQIDDLHAERLFTRRTGHLPAELYGRQP